MRVRGDEKRILRLWNSPSFPGSFTSARRFKEELKKHAGIEIGQKMLENILNKDLAYQMSRTRVKNPHKKRIIGIIP